MFEYYNNILCVRASWLEEAGVVSQNSLKVLCFRNKVNKLRSGRGLGNYALYAYESLPKRFRDKVQYELGIDPYAQSRKIDLATYIKPCDETANFFDSYDLGEKLLSEVNPQAVLEYTSNAMVLQAIHQAVGKIKAAQSKVSKGELWRRLSQAVTALQPRVVAYCPFDLPANPRALRAKYEACILERPNRRYKRPGLEGLIHDNYCNQHSIKITPQIGDWLISCWALPTTTYPTDLLQAYNMVRGPKAWPELSESGIMNYINRPDIERIWREAKHGSQSYKNKFGHKLKRKRSDWFSAAYWAIDGTKLDCAYLTADGKMVASKKINVIFCVHSEKIIGYSFSETETHVDHYVALQMAVQTTGLRPYLFTYDKQSGHTSQRMQDLYSKIVASGGTHYSHQARGHASPAEGIFNRLQQQVVRKWWFSDGQGIRTKRESSRANMELLLANKRALPTEQELQKAWEIMVSQWNNATHPKYKNSPKPKTRNEVYHADLKEMQHMDPLTQVALFWLDESRPITYRAAGIKLTLAGTTYEYEVYTQDNDVDLEFRRKYVGAKFTLRYAPEFLDEYVALYKENHHGQQEFIAYAQKKREHQTIPFLKQEGDHAAWLRDMKVREIEMQRDRSRYQEIASKTGLTQERLIEMQQDVLSNNVDFSAKMQEFLTKEESTQVDRKSIFENINSNS